MPLKDPEKRKEYAKKRYEENKEKWKEYAENYREKKRELDRKYYEKNKEKRNTYHKEYRKTDAGIKSHRISAWKRYGIVCDDWDALYDKYINTWNCEYCDVELVEGNYGGNKKCIDHDHQTGLFRAVLCCGCNNLSEFKETKNNI